MKCDSRDRFPKVCVGRVVVMYPNGEATSFHCYPCSQEIESLPPVDGEILKAVILRGEEGRHERQKRFYEANPPDLR